MLRSRNLKLCCFLTIFTLICLLSLGAPLHAGRGPAGTTAVLCSPADPYRVLAEEIALTEGLPLTDTFDEAELLHPEFLLWVVAPHQLSDSVLIAAGKLMAERLPEVSHGIISGGTIEHARRLWKRRFDASTGYLARAGPVKRSINSGGMIWTYRGGRERQIPLTKEAVIDVLRETDYFEFRGRGGGTYWILGPGRSIGSEEIPPLGPAIVSSGACQSFRPWRDGSIALAFADSGAACFSGFVYSPLPYYMIGDPWNFAYLHSWPGFPVGRIIRVQVEGMMRGFMPFHWYHLLGDPRIALRSDMPYRLVDDEVQGGTRILRFTDAEAGVLPVRVPDGAQFRYAEIPGIGSAYEGDIFYNGRLEMVDVGSDKYLLFIHNGGDFALRLEADPPLLRMLARPVRDSLDYTIVFLPRTGGVVFFVAIAGLALFAVLWFVKRRSVVRSTWFPAAAIGVFFALAEGIYMAVRLEHISVVSTTLWFNPLSLVEKFLLFGCAALMFFNVRARWARAGIFLVATFPSWGASAFWLAAIAYINLVGARPRLGADIYNYAPCLPPLITFFIECVVLGAVVALVSWIRAAKVRGRFY
jgi:hypothetical protein